MDSILSDQKLPTFVLILFCHMMILSQAFSAFFTFFSTDMIVLEGALLPSLSICRACFGNRAVHCAMQAWQLVFSS